MLWSLYLGLYFNAGFRVRTTVVVIAGVFLQVTVVVLLLLGYWGDHVDLGDPAAGIIGGTTWISGTLLLGYWGDHVDLGGPGGPNTAFGRVRRLPTVGWALYRFLSLLSLPSHGNYF